MAAQSLAIILVISKNRKINGFNSTTNESESLTLMTSKSTALEDNTGEDKVKVPIYLSMKKSKKCL